MGQKVNPIGLRLGINRTWDSTWYADKKKYGELLHEDLKLRKYIKNRLYAAGISRVQIERAANRVRVPFTLHGPEWSSGGAAPRQRRSVATLRRSPASKCR